MIIESITKDKKKNKYLVKINDSIYTFNEDIIIEFNLYKGKEVNDDLINKALESNNLNDYYNIALSYSAKYYKGSGEIKKYLLDKGLDIESTNKIIDKLIQRGIINDKKIIEGIIYSLIKSSNGKNLIIEKLKMKSFKYDLIMEAIENIDMDLYYESLSKLYEKIKNKYDKYPDYVRIGKIKNYLFMRGYSSNDISILDIN